MFLYSRSSKSPNECLNFPISLNLFICNRLSILSKWRMNIEKVIDIEPESFSPAPRVKSSLLVFIPKTKYYKINDDSFSFVTEACAHGADTCWGSEADWLELKFEK
mgnify:CR=1 FL=1